MDRISINFGPDFCMISEIRIKFRTGPTFDYFKSGTDIYVGDSGSTNGLRIRIPGDRKPRFGSKIRISQKLFDERT